jgi:hypothetical protein
MNDVTFKHTQTIKSMEIDNDTLAEEIGDLYYDSLAVFFTALSKKLENDAAADAARGRKKLASHLHESSKHIAKASVHMDKAWDICAPYVKEWSNENGSNRE